MSSRLGVMLGEVRTEHVYLTVGGWTHSAGVSWVGGSGGA